MIHIDINISKFLNIFHIFKLVILKSEQCRLFFTFVLLRYLLYFPIILFDSSNETKGKMTAAKSGKRGFHTQAHGASLKVSSGKHFVLFCPLFSSKTPEQRQDLIRKCGLCFNISGKHMARECIFPKRFQTCSGLHHTILNQSSCGTTGKESGNKVTPSTSNLNLNSALFTPVMSAVNAHIIQAST